MDWHVINAKDRPGVVVGSFSTEPKVKGPGFDASSLQNAGARLASDITFIDPRYLEAANTRSVT